MYFADTASIERARAAADNSNDVLCWNRNAKVTAS